MASLPFATLWLGLLLRLVLLLDLLCRPDMPRRSMAAGILPRLPRMLPPALPSALDPSARLLLLLLPRITPPPKGKEAAAAADALLPGLSGTGRLAMACSHIRSLLVKVFYTESSNTCSCLQAELWAIVAICSGTSQSCLKFRCHICRMVVHCQHDCRKA